MTERQQALYRYLTVWADYSPEEAKKIISSTQFTVSAVGGQIPSDAYTARWNTARTGTAG